VLIFFNFFFIVVVSGGDMVGLGICVLVVLYLYGLKSKNKNKEEPLFLVPVRLTVETLGLGTEVCILCNCIPSLYYRLVDFVI
jgi:hypothetical protein